MWENWLYHGPTEAYSAPLAGGEGLTAPSPRIPYPFSALQAFNFGPLGFAPCLVSPSPVTKICPWEELSLIKIVHAILLAFEHTISHLHDVVTLWTCYGAS